MLYLHSFRYWLILTFACLNQTPAPRISTEIPASHAELGRLGFPIPKEDVSAKPTGDLHGLVDAVLKRADDGGCFKSRCKLLVANFALPNGNSSIYGRRLADAV